MTPEFHPAAEAEYLGYVQFYEARIPGLGKALIAEVDALTKALCRHPKAWVIEQPPNIRKASLRQFPLSLIFRVEQQRIQILALAHDRRRPAYWHRRR